SKSEKAIDSGYRRGLYLPPLCLADGATDITPTGNFQGTQTTELTTKPKIQNRYLCPWPDET
ncbi:MAG: hypothetical protein AAFY20_08565, partial [Cyanobacteria bacterium J06639_14]